MKDPILASLVPGLFALLGAFIGAWLTRRTEYEKWLRQSRTDAFATLLAELHDARTSAASAPGTEGERRLQVTEVYAGVQKHVARARLFIRAEARDTLENLVKKVWLESSGKDGPSQKVSEINALMVELQALLERELEHLPWKPRWPFR